MAEQPTPENTELSVNRVDSEHPPSTPTERTSLLNQISDDFNDALQQEAPGTTILQVISNRPGASIVALCLITLIVLYNTTFQSFSLDSVVQTVNNAANVSVVKTHFNRISMNEVELASELQIAIDYDLIPDSFQSTIFKLVGQKFGTVELSFPEPIKVAHQNNHFADLNVTDSCEIDITPDAIGVYNINSTLYNIGNVTSVIHKWLHSQPLDLQVQTTVEVHKYGIGIPIPVNISKTVYLKAENPNITQISVYKPNKHEDLIAVTTELEVEMPNLPISGSLPNLEWTIRVPGCTKDVDIRAESTVEIESEQPQQYLLVNFTTFLTEIPTQLTMLCPHLSKLDVYVNKYLSGSDQYPDPNLVLRYDNNVLDLGELEVPLKFPIKADTEHLVKNIEILKVRMNRFSKLLDFTKFSGEAHVEIEIPDILALQSGIFSAKQARGVFTLISLAGVPFAEITADEFMPIISLESPQKFDLITKFESLPVNVLDAREFSSFSRKLAIYGSADIKYHSLIDCVISSSLGMVTIQKLEFDGATTLKT